jgi:predicted dehydrogenase
VEDDVTIFARYENGATGVFITTTGEFPGTNRLEISGTRGKLVIEEGKLKWWKLDQDTQTVSREAGSTFSFQQEVETIPQTIPETAHAGILQNFSDAMRFGTELLSPGTDGIFELSISNAAYLSSAKGSVPVALPLDGKEFDALLAKLVEASSEKNGKADKMYNTKYHERWQIRW